MSSSDIADCGRDRDGKKTEIGAEGMHTYLTLPVIQVLVAKKGFLSQQYDE